MEKEREKKEFKTKYLDKSLKHLKAGDFYHVDWSEVTNIYWMKLVPGFPQLV